MMEMTEMAPNNAEKKKEHQLAIQEKHQLAIQGKKPG